VARFWRRGDAARRTTEEERVVTPPPRPRPFWPWLLLLLLLVLAGLGALWYFTMREDTVEAARVPSVVGLQREAAEERVRERGFDEEIKRVVSPQSPGTVIDQRPPAGTLYGKRGIVVLSVARNPLEVEVPDVRGLPTAVAVSRLRAVQLKPRTQPVASPRPRGRVVRQIPEAGAEVPRNSAAVIFVSAGRQLVGVPSLVGLSADEATTMLATSGFRAEVRQVPSSEPEGTVVAQRPRSGTRAPRGSIVQIDVATGPAETATTVTATTATTTAPTQRIPVPDTVGQDEATATATLEGAGFVVRMRTRRVTDPAFGGIVLEQTPAGGRAPRGSTVTIVVGLLQ
jgi:beta-lactam-binding protein with PASTA domain